MSPSSTRSWSTGRQRRWSPDRRSSSRLWAESSWSVGCDRLPLQEPRPTEQLKRLARGGRVEQVIVGGQPEEGLDDGEVAVTGGTAEADGQHQLGERVTLFGREIGEPRLPVAGPPGRYVPVRQARQGVGRAAMVARFRDGCRWHRPGAQRYGAQESHDICLLYTS